MTRSGVRDSAVFAAGRERFSRVSWAKTLRLYRSSGLRRLQRIVLPARLRLKGIRRRGCTLVQFAERL